MRTSPNGRLRHRCIAILLPLALGSCAGLGPVDQGALQPQTVTGPCQVQKFYLVNFRATPTEMTVANTGQACSITLINPILQVFTTAALITEQPSHGQATSAVLAGGFQGGATYTPQPGYVGPDRFTLTMEPNDRAIAVHVQVQPPG